MLTIPTTQRGRRFAQLLVGLTTFGVGLALMVRAELGLGPWEVLHQGLSERSGLTIGTAGILVGILVMLAWVPLRERPGVGTVLNVAVVGVVIDLTLVVVDDLSGTVLRWAILAVGIALVGSGTALYIGAGLGPGPRDGLMTGWSRRNGTSLRAVRTTVELGALAVGWALGGQVGPGTVLFAVAIGPLLQAVLGRVTIPAPPPAE
ncbi:MAG TPA: hypothetical protein VM938_01800 [Acidimicrobiales bacterium]|nr:hypothetical protein [Acidimicrobiales bacterium]